MLSPARLIIPILLSLMLMSSVAIGQSVFWRDIREDSIVADFADRQIIPNKYRTSRLDFALLRARLLSAPQEEDYLNGIPGAIIDFPTPDGEIIPFEVWEAPVLHPDLGAAFPDIRSFAGKSRTGNGMAARFDISPNGLHSMIFNPGGSTIFIDPYARYNTADYICYFKKEFLKRTGDVFICHVNEPVEITLPTQASDRAGDCGSRRQYRLALACTGEYANYHGSYGSDKAPALAAMNTTMTRVNGVFERDCSVSMIIVANNAAIIFTDPANDPYTNNNGSVMLGENQTTCDNIIGSVNYDIGHVFSTGGGGIATLNSPCNNGIKARAVTGLPNPIGDPFDIDYVAHEMGHQYGAQHTQYNNCNRSNNSAMEPGSASTIMGYAGICAPNVQNNSDDYFHAQSLQQIGAFVTGAGNGCAQKVSTGNTAPVISPALSNRNIPHSTPFVLSGNATDGNGDALTYCWEQMNAFSSPAQPMPPETTNSTGPVFRSLLPDESNARYMPNFPAVLANYMPTWEVLPSIGRTMSFRFTVRDNNPNGGCTTEGNMTVTTSGAIGPFAVTSPNGGESYPVGSTQTVTWNVAGSNGAPVNCAIVEILISVDGGATFSTLLTSTPNDGSQSVVLNVPPTTSARIMVKALGNIFYDVSNGDFAITVPLPVQLTTFKASLEGDDVRLQWETASEQNNRGFQIERSKDDILHFESIIWVAGKGNSTLVNRYELTDVNPPAGHVLYYRLRQVDFDGKENLSEIRSVVMSPRKGQEIFMQPNPTSGKTMLLLPPTIDPGTVQAFIISPSGLVQNAILNGNEIDVSHLDAGFYWLHIITGNQVFYGRFVRQGK